jgi:hypothetical protein
MSKEIYANDSYDLVVSTLGEALYEFSDGPDPKPVKDHKSTQLSTSKIHPWGDDNNFPGEIMAELEKNSDLGSFLDLQARTLYSGGVTYDVYDIEAGELIPGKKIPEIEAFIFQNWYYPIQAAVDFYKFFNVFPEFTLSKSRKKINWLICRPANQCRYETQNVKTGVIDHCYINANWAESIVEDKYTQKRRVLNPILDLPSQLQGRRDTNTDTYIYPLSYPTGRTYYQLANWNALRKSKWLELANMIPEFKLAMMKNQLSIKYHIKISSEYWRQKYEGRWESFTPEEKVTKKQEAIAAINTFLKGASNAGKSLTTNMGWDKAVGKEIPGVEISAIDDKIKDGVYLEDSVEATIKIFSALGLDPSILGIVPGKGGSNRSGSDKREALNIYISLIQPHANLLLRPYEFISYYNGWNTAKQLIQWRFKAPLLQTLDQVTPKKRHTIPDEPGAEGDNETGD